MTYMQIGAVSYNWLDERSLDFLEGADMEMFCHIEGDESRPCSVELVEKTLDTVLEELAYGERVVFNGEPNVPLPKGYIRINTWWGGVAWQKDVD